MELPPFAGAKSLLIVPIMKKGSMLGFIGLWNRQVTGAFGKNQFLITSAVAGQLAESIQNLKNRENEVNREKLNRARTDL